MKIRDRKKQLYTVLRSRAARELVSHTLPKALSEALESFDNQFEDDISAVLSSRIDAALHENKILKKGNAA